jgi:hypothetical protein
MDTFKKITLDEQALFTEILNATDSMASEYTFSYLYMWRRNYNLSYAIIEDHLCLVSRSKIYPAFSFCPLPVDGNHDPVKFEKAIEAIESYFEQNDIPVLFGRIEEKKLPFFKEVYGDRIQIESLDSTSDYVYNAKDLITLEGKKFSKKRNNINQFMRRYGEYEYTPVNESNLHECKRILEEWAEKNETNIDEEISEKVACKELCNNWGTFPLKGALIKVNGRYEAFTIGEQLNPEAAVIHIEKGNTDIHGIYTVINRDFCANEWSQVKYINRQEDLGIKGLRKSKLSYNPAFMVEKFLVKVSH